jgi:hypothetical protein
MKTRTFSYSRILDYATCPHKHYLRNVCGIVSKNKHKALSFGHCMSEGMREWRKAGDLNSAKEAFVKAWDLDGKNLKMTFDIDDPKDYRTVKRGFEILQAYANEYPSEPQQTLQSEIKFDGIFLGVVEETEIYLRGRIDSIFTIGNDISIDEDKTTSQLGPMFFNSLRDSMQVGLYLWVANQLGLFNIGNKPTTPRCILNAILVHPKETRFARDITIKSRSKLRAVKNNCLDWARQILIAEKLNIFPMNDVDNSICTKYGGCDYLPLRYVDGSMRERLLEAEYVIKEKKEN